MARTAASQITMTFFGNPRMSLVVDAYKTTKSDTKSTVAAVTVCPECDDPTQNRQVFVCDEHGEHTMAEMHRAIKGDDGTLRKVSAEALAAAKSAGLLPDKVATVKVFDAESVDLHTRVGDNSYRLAPSAQGTGKNKKIPDEQMTLFSLFLDAIANNPDKACLFEMVMRGIQKLYMLTVWNGDLVMQELIRPGEFQEAVEVEKVGYDSRLLDKVDETFGALTEEFDPDTFANFYRDRAAKLAEQVASGEVPEVTAAPAAVVAEDDLFAALSASVDAVKAKKAPAKRARKAS